GLFTSTLGATEADFRAIAIQTDGKIVATGSVSSGSATVVTARLNGNGTLDSSFDGDGYTPTNFTSGDENGYGIALQSDGKIVVAGDTNGGLMVLRFTTSGSLDTSFSLDGIVNHQPGGYGAWGRNVAIASDGKIVAVGGGVEVGSPEKRMMLVRLNTDGTF